MGKKRLRKPVKKALDIIGTAAVVCTSTVLFTKDTTTTVKALSPKQTANLIAGLQSRDMDDSQIVKKSVLETYKDIMGDELSEDTTVVMSYPAAVTTPTFTNSTFEIVSNDTIVDNTEDGDVDVTNKNITESSEEPPGNNQDSKVSTDESGDKAVNSSKSGTSLIMSDATKKSNEALSSEISDNVDDKSKKNATTKEVADGTDSDKEMVDGGKDIDENASATKVDLDSISTLTEATDISTNSDTAKKDTENDDENESFVGTYITLEKTSVTIQRESKFNALDYINITGAPNNPFPSLKTEGTVDEDKLGTYKITYTVVDLDGTKEIATLNVEVVKSDADIKTEEEARKAKEAEEKAKAQIATNSTWAQAFANETIGKSWDIDGNDPWCVDIWLKYVVDNGLTSFDYSCTPSGYAHSIYKKYDTSGASKYFDRIDAANVQAGDWLFWDTGSSCPLSHVALLLKNNGDGTGEVLTQSHNTTTRVLTLKLDVLGGFRRK